MTNVVNNTSCHYLLVKEPEWDFFRYSIKPLYADYRSDAVSGIKEKQSWDYILWSAIFYCCHYLKYHNGFSDSFLNPCIQNISSSQIKVFILWNNEFEEAYLSVVFTNNWHFSPITLSVSTAFIKFVLVNLYISVQLKAMLNLTLNSCVTHQLWWSWSVFEKKFIWKNREITWFCLQFEHY